MSDLLSLAAQRHSTAERCQPSWGTTRWFSWNGPSHGGELWWSQRTRVRRAHWSIGWCLELERGATGVLAHLSAEPLGHAGLPVPAPLVRLALDVMAERELASLAQQVAPSDRASAA